MSEEKYAEGLPIANIVLGQIIDEITGKSYVFDTANKAEAKPHLSKGKEDILRVKNRIIAQNETEDIVLGYELSLTDCTFKPEVFAIIDGGNITSTGGYQGAEIGVVCERHPFTLNLYSEEKDYDSSTIKYIKFTYKHCKGKPVEFKFEDGKFYIPSYKAKSKPKRKERPVYIEYVNVLPDGNTDPNISIPEKKEIKINGDKVEKSNKDVKIEVTGNIKWYFKVPINQDDSTNKNFIVQKDSKPIEGAVTIDDTKKIVSFIPKDLVIGTYTAESKAVRKLDGSGNTEPISITFTTI